MGASFPEFLLQKLQEYERVQGKRISFQSFADYLGVSRALISHWMNGKGKPSPENVDLISIKLGPEVYDSLNLPRPDPRISEIKRIYDAVPEDDKDSFVELVEEIARNRGWEPGI